MSNKSHDSESRSQGQQVITAVAFIHADFDGVKKVFLPKRAATKKFLPNVFELPGGHIEFGEDLEVGLAREIQEEIGMKIKIGEVFSAFTYMNEVKGSHSVELVYFAEFVEPFEKIKLNPGDHAEYLWASNSDLDAIEITFEEKQNIMKGFSILDEKID